MEPSIRNQVVKILISEAELVKNRKMFYDSLNLDEAEYSLLNHRFMIGIVTSYELFSEFLVKWTNRNSESVTTVITLCQILRNDGFQNVADKLKSWTQRMDRKRKMDTPIWFEVNKRAKNFVGRTKELEKLEDLLKNDEDIVTITGMGGVGKTELVKTFAKQIAEENLVDCIFLNGESEESLNNSISRLAQFQGISIIDSFNQPKNTTSLFTDIILSIPHQYKIVVIIDNIDKENKIILPILEDVDVCRKNCYFLFTSRNTSVLDYAGEIITLDVLTNEEAQDLVKSAIPDESNNNIKELCNLLGNFPLALQQALGFFRVQRFEGIKGKSYGILDYIETYHRRKAELLSFPLNEYEHDYKLTTLTIWKISMDKIQEKRELGELASYLLNVFAYFNPDQIGLDFLKAVQVCDLFSTATFEYDRVEKAVTLLKRYSLVQLENAEISIHRFLQEVIRTKISVDNLEVAHLRKMMTAIQPSLTWVESQVGVNLKMFEFKHLGHLGQRLKYIKSGMGHIESMWNHLTKHRELIGIFKMVSVHIYKTMKFFRFGLGHTCIFAKSNYNTLREFLRKNDEITLKMESYFVFEQTLKLDSNRGEALRQLTEIYSKQKKNLKKDHEVTIQTLELIATTLWIRRYDADYKIGCNNKSIDAYRDVINLKKSKLGPEHKSTMQTIYKLSNLLNELYEKEAVDLCEESFQWMQKNFPENHPETLNIMYMFGVRLFRYGDYEKSAAIFNDFLALSLRENQDIYESSTFECIHCMMEIIGAEDPIFKTERSFEGWWGYEINKDDTLSDFQEAETLFQQQHYQESLGMFNKLLQADHIEDFTCIAQDCWQDVVDNKVSLCLTKLCEIEVNLTNLESVLDDVAEQYNNKKNPVHDKINKLILKCRDHLLQI